MSLPEIPGLLSADDLRRTADSIAEVQLPDGMIPWFTGGHADPWNHVEAAMALAVSGHLDEAEAAYGWLAASQHDDGAWHAYYVDGDVEDPKFDTNVIAYVATGAWHHWLLTRDRGFLESLWPVVERALDYVLDLQTPRGEILWARHAGGTPWSYALLTGSSSVCHSLRCGIAVAEELGDPFAVGFGIVGSPRSFASSMTRSVGSQHLPSVLPQLRLGHEVPIAA